MTSMDFVTDLALAEKPTFHNVNMCAKVVSLIKKRPPFWHFSSLTWCSALLLHKNTIFEQRCFNFVKDYFQKCVCDDIMPSTERK